MVNRLSKDLEIQENKNSLQESSFDNEVNKQGLADIENESIKVHKQQNKKAEQLKDLLDTKDTMKQSPSIIRIPPPSNIHLQRKDMILETLPGNGTDKLIDYCSYNLSKLDIEKDTLPHIMFNKHTQWPAGIDKDFHPEEILERGKNPGINVKDLHNREIPITGKGINIAIIDKTLLVDHQEYKDQLEMYDEIGVVDEEAQSHGSAVASLAVGKNCGVAPEANLYYIGVKSGKKVDGKFIFNLSEYAKGIDKITEMNKSLLNKKDPNRIRVISISLGLMERTKDRDPEGTYEIVKESIRKAEEEGIYVIQTADKHFMGAGRDPKKDPNEFGSYTKPKRQKEKELEKTKYKNNILFPMDSRTVASPTGDKEYDFYPEGGYSWAVPYVAGIYALCCQVKPSIDKDSFWKAAHTTSHKTIIDGEEIEIINPVKLIEYLEKN